MKAMVLKGPTTPFELRDVPDPVAGPGEAVARVLACGAGLTIQHIKAGRIAADFPRIKEEFENGREYYQHRGNLLVTFPGRPDERPSTEFLRWHNEHVYLG